MIMEYTTIKFLMVILLTFKKLFSNIKLTDRVFLSILRKNIPNSNLVSSFDKLILWKFSDFEDMSSTIGSKRKPKYSTNK